MNKQAPNNLTNLVHELPEIYQPIYGYNELSIDTSRTCSDRMEYIGQIYKLLECELNRPLRVLDLGCAQGFFSLSLAQMGATVKGIDFLDKNIAVCQALARENSEFDVTFEVGRIEYILDNLKEGEYDLVMGLSVFHHLVHEHGLSIVQDMIKELAQKVKIGIFELALSTEPLYWGESQAKQPRMLLNGFSFVHEIAEHTTHLSNISRPLFVTSNIYWLLDNKIGLFDAYTDESHEYARGTHQTTRRYFFTDKLIIKLYRLDNLERFNVNLKEFKREIDFLLNYSDIMTIPKLLLHGKNHFECWIVREKLEGRLLLDIIDCDEDYNVKQIIEDVLGELVALEKHGLYHEDFRTWNVLINNQGNATLIDHGSISNDKHDCVWPDDVFLSFLIFIIEVTNKKVFLPEMIRNVNFDIGNLTEPYRSAFIRFFTLPVEKLSFAKLYGLISDSENKPVNMPSGLIVFPHLLQITSNTFKDIVEHLSHKNSEMHTKVSEAVIRANEAEVKAQTRATKAEARAAETEDRANEALASAHHAWQSYHTIENSNSWKLTKPLRATGKGVRWFINGTKAWLTFSPTSRPRGIYDSLFFREVKEIDTVNNYEMIYGCNTDRNKPVVVADMYVLGQDVKTGIYRVCDEIYKRLDESDQINFNYYAKEPFIESSEHYLKDNEFKCFEQKELLKEKVNEIDFFLAPFGVALYDLVNKRNIKHVHFIYDLIAIKHPEYFTEKGAKEVKEIMDSLDSETIIFAISEYTKKELLDYRKDITSEQITVIPLSSDIKFTPSLNQNLKKEVCQKYHIPYNKPYILSLATLEVRKNVETTIEAFNRYLLDNPTSDLNLVLSGMSGWKLDKLQEKIQEYKSIENRIIFTGFVDEVDLPSLYSNALAFIYMSRYEGFGLPPLEAMACGVPVITSNNSSLPEVIGDAGFMFDCDDYVNVATTIEKLFNDNRLREKYSELSVNRAKLFNWDTTTEIILDRLNKERDKKRDNSLRWIKTLAFENEKTKVEGGLRTKGVFKKSKPNMPLISYITVVWNNEKDIRRTIESVQNQTYENVEHILLDGFSTDDTLKIIKEYKEKVDYFASEKDDGLYDALNKAIPLCNGDLICVLNSDDWLPENAAEIVVNNFKGDRCELVLGSAQVELNDLETIVWNPALVSNCSYFTVANCCHNAIYATKKAYENSGLYDDTYKIAADFKWIMSCFDSGSTFTYVKDVVVNYSLGGISSDTNTHILESKRVIKDKFSFLNESEVDIINYSYYTWREELNHEAYIDIDFESEILQLYIKYNFSKQFADALDCNKSKGLNNKLMYEARYIGIKNKVKTVLKKSPKSYVVMKRVYNFIK